MCSPTIDLPPKRNIIERVKPEIGIAIATNRNAQIAERKTPLHSGEPNAGAGSNLGCMKLTGWFVLPNQEGCDEE